MTARSLARGLAVVLILAVVLVAVVETRARSELDLARASAKRSDWRESLKHYSRALNWYVPFGASGTAAEELLALGLRLDGGGEKRLASTALMRLRSGLYGARSFYTPRPDLLEKAEPALARLMAAEKLGDKPDPAKLALLTKTYLDEMRTPSRPRPGYALAASGGFLVWTEAVLLFIWRFFRKENGGWKAAWPFAALWAVGFALWLWGMRWA